MKLPVETFVEAIAERKVYYFASERLNTPEPHYYICIKKTDDDILILSCCTSQFETVKRFVETRNLPYETLVYINPDADDQNCPFYKQTFINCNEYHSYTVEDFKNMYAGDTVSFSGEIGEGHFEQIIIGLHASPMIEEEIKEILPKPEQQ